MLVALAVGGAEQRQLRARVASFAAEDDSHPGRPRREHVGARSFPLRRRGEPDRPNPPTHLRPWAADVIVICAIARAAYRNRRVATELIHRVLDEIRETGRKITIICPVVGEFVAHHPEYLDLIDTVHPGSGAYPDRHAAGGSDHGERITALERDLA